MSLTTTEVTNFLSKQHIKAVKEKENKPSLLLIGSHNSPFLRSVNRLAQEVGYGLFKGESNWLKIQAYSGVYSVDHTHIFDMR